MISLSLTNEALERYCDLDGFLVGPIFSAGTTREESISSRSQFDFLTQGRGKYHENNVDNLQIHADLTHQPLFLEITPAPSLEFPDRISWACKTLTGSRTTTLMRNGLASQDRVAMWNTTAEWYQVLIDRCDPDDFQVISVAAGRTSIYRLFSAVTIRRYKKTSIDGNRFYYEPSSYTFTGMAPAINAINWSVRQSAATIRGLIAGKGYTLTSSSIQYSTIFGLGNPISLSIKDVMRQVEMLAIAHLQPENFPTKEMHYGDLAMKASAKVNANQVNMIAFIADLRRPKEMLLKLRNLRKLKTLADNYLTINYGWLPTISDLQEIWEAMNRAKPYFDRHGFEIYTSGHRDVVLDGVRTFKLEQYLKIAIDDVDEGVKGLIGAVDSIGFLPTLENVWDLIPYSFVIDWFIGVGDFLERVDSHLRLLRLGIQYVTMSRKKTGTYDLVPTPSLPFSGTIELVHYQRWTSDQCPVPPLSAPSNTEPFDHWLEASALLVQRKKK